MDLPSAPYASSGSKTGAALGLPDEIKIHHFRHTYGTFLAQEDLIGTQISMGHEDIKTTMLYVHPDDRKVRVAAARWSALLGSDAQVTERESGTNR